MVIHHVFFWLKEPSVTNCKKLAAGLQTLKAIKTVWSIHIGVPAATENRDVVDNSYSVSELLFFDNLEGQQAYQVDPIHKKFIEDYGHMWSKVIVYDSIDLDK